jgi:hypothetical protein
MFFSQRFFILPLNSTSFRYHFLRRVRDRSMPPNNNAGSSWLNITRSDSSPFKGQLNRPFSSRFAQTQNPLRWQTKMGDGFELPVRACPGLIHKGLQNLLHVRRSHRQVDPGRRSQSKHRSDLLQHLNDAKQRFAIKHGGFEMATAHGFEP